MSGCSGFSTCRIQFIPNNRPNAERNYSDRSLVELRQHDFAKYSIRALDIENNREEIFDVPLENEDQYKRGKSSANPDEVLTRAGTYRLWLNATSRNKFHDALYLAIQEIELLNPGSSHTSTTPSDVTSKSKTHDDYQESKPDPRYDDQEPRSNPQQKYRDPKPDPRYDGQEPRSNAQQKYRDPKPDPGYDDQEPTSNPQQKYRDPKPDPRYDDQEPRSNPQQKYRDPKPDPRYDDHESKLSTQSNRNDILVSVYQLGQNIRQGNIDAAINLATKLSKNHVRLQANLRQEQNEERSKQIRVRIDSNDKTISRKYNEDLIIDVYPSTTIGELRTAFEYLHEFPPSNQYFFVHGHLAHETTTMNELDIHSNPLFVLFIIKQ